MNSKIHLKIGDIEIDYEGDSAFLSDDIINLLKRAIETTRALTPSTAALESARSGALSSDLSTNTIASVLGATTGSDLLIAAAAHLTFVKGQSQFSRKGILDEMQGAATFYRTSYSNNLSKTLNTLVKGKRLNMVSTDTFALSATERKALEAKLAQ